MTGVFAFATFCLLLSGRTASAELGWTLSDYEARFGPAQKGYGRYAEVGFQVGQNRLVVEFAGERSVAELWQLGVVRDAVPESVRKAAELAAAGEKVGEVRFLARGSLPAELYETVVDGIVVRVDVRNQLVHRVAFCGRRPTCSLFDRLRKKCVLTAACPILDRALRIDTKLDRIQVAAERALERER